MRMRLLLILSAILVVAAAPAASPASSSPVERSVANCAAGTYWTSKPVLSGPAGNPPAGSVITTTPGAFGGIPNGCAYEIRYQWYRYNTSLDVAPYSIPNSNSSSYTLVGADIGFAIGVCAYAYPGQIPSSGGMAHILDCSATTLTVRAADAPAPAPVPVPAPTAVAAVAKAPSAPTGVRWSPPASGAPFTATFTPAAGTTYSISASSAARKSAKGACKAKGAKMTCVIRLAKGKWVVSITPTKGGVVGTPLKKTVTVGAAKR
jgi:hypothetical protein